MSEQIEQEQTEKFSNEDYAKLKFKAGLEIHQQLDSDKKLFCNCPTLLRKDSPEFIVKRKLHAVAGESGEVDVAALYQKSLNKNFEYQGYDTTCLVEIDEEPPHEINKQALKIAVQIALLLNMKIISLTQIMRKTVIDGSNTSGFQRSIMIARDGEIESSLGKIKISALYLEEDAARIISDEGKKEIYRLDRLGIPLVEIVTAPDLKTPEHTKEVALQIGEILRSCKVKRGIGTIRQDVNLSIRGENRIEIKGMQNMEIFLRAIENEVIRQKNLSDSKNPVKMETRKVLPNATTKYMRPLPGSARMYPETDLPLLKISRDFINDAKKDLPDLKKDVEKELRKKGISQEMVLQLFKQNKLNLFEELLKIKNSPELVAKMILLWPKEISTHKKIELEKVEEILEENYFEILQEKNLSDSEIKRVMNEIVEGKNLKEALNFEKIETNDVEEFIVKLIKEKPGLNPNAYMGLVMKNFSGKVEGKIVMEIINKVLK